MTSAARCLITVPRYSGRLGANFILFQINNCGHDFDSLCASMARAVCQVVVSSRYKLRALHHLVNLLPEEPPDWPKFVSVIAVEYCVIVITYDWNG